MLSTLTGEIRKLADDGWMASFSPNGGRIAFLTSANNEIWVMGPKGENPHRFATVGPDNDIFDFAWSPDGERIAYVKVRGVNAGFNSLESAIEIRDISRGEPRVLLARPRIGALAWTSDGRLIYSTAEPPPRQDANDLWELALDPRTAQPVGEPRRVAGWLAQSVESITVSTDCRRIALTRGRTQCNVYVGDLGPGDSGLKAVRRLTQNDRLDWPSGWSADSRSVFFHSDRNGDFDLFRQGLSERAAQPLLLGAGDVRAAQLSPDGRWILYLAWGEFDNRSGDTKVRLMRLPVAGGPASPVLETTGNWGTCEGGVGVDTEGSWSYPAFRCPSVPSAPCVISEASQKQVVFSAFDPAGGRKGELARVDTDPGRAAWDLSPDGSRIALAKFDLGAGLPVKVITLADKGVREIPLKGWSNPMAVAWSRGGKDLFVMNYAVKGSTLLSVDPAGRVRVLYDLFGKGKYLTNPHPSPDGRSLAFAQSTAGSNVWILETPTK